MSDIVFAVDIVNYYWQKYNQESDAKKKRLVTEHRQDDELTASTQSRASNQGLLLPSQAPTLSETNASPTGSFLPKVSDEVLRMIVEYLCADDIDNLSIAMDTVRKLLKRSFPRYLKRWSDVSCGGVMSGTEASHPLHLLANLLAKPAIASKIATYPKTWLIEGCNSWTNLEDKRFCHEIPINIRRLAQELQKEVGVAIGAFSWLKTEEKESWSHEILSCKQGPALTLLASIMPGIETLVILDSASIVKYLDPNSQNLSTAFSRLSYVETGATRQGAYENIAALPQFLQLPSIRSFRGIRLADERFAALPRTPYDHGGARLENSSLTKLVLDDCALCTDTLANIFAPIKALEEFTYTCHWPQGTGSYDYERCGERGHWEPCCLIDDLLDAARYSLVSLDLTHRGEYCGPANFDYSVGRRLREFENLRNVRMEYMMLVKDKADPRTEERGHCLVAIMPESLEFLSLAGPICTEREMGEVLGFLPKGDSEDEDDWERDESEGDEPDAKWDYTCDMLRALGFDSADFRKSRTKEEEEDKEEEEKEEDKEEEEKEEGEEGREEGLKVADEDEFDEQEEFDDDDETGEDHFDYDTPAMRRRRLLPDLMIGEKGVPNLREIIFENFDRDETLNRLLEPFKQAAEFNGIRFCEAQLVPRPRYPHHIRLNVDVKEPMLVDVVNNHLGRSYRVWTEVSTSPDPSPPQALVFEFEELYPFSAASSSLSDIAVPDCDEDLSNSLKHLVPTQAWRSQQISLPEFLESDKDLPNAQANPIRTETKKLPDTSPPHPLVFMQGDDCILLEDCIPVEKPRFSFIQYGDECVLGCYEGHTIEWHGWRFTISWYK